jgi:hypothetical protein
MKGLAPMDHTVPHRSDFRLIFNDTVPWIAQKRYDMLKALLMIRGPSFQGRFFKRTVGKSSAVRHDTDGLTDFFHRTGDQGLVVVHFKQLVFD